MVEVDANGGNRGVELILDDGTLAVVSNTRSNPHGYDVRLEVHGSNDSIEVGLDRFLPAYRAELDVFTELVIGDHFPPCTVADALEADLIAEACGLSVREHRPVRMEEVRP